MKLHTVRACLPCLRDFRYGKIEFGSQDLQIRMPIGSLLVIVQRMCPPTWLAKPAFCSLVIGFRCLIIYPVFNPSIVKIDYQCIRSFYLFETNEVLISVLPCHFFPLIQYLLLGIARHGLIIRMISPLISMFDGLGQLQEGIAVGRSFAMFKNYNIDGNKEMIAFGMMNIVGSCTSCYLTTGNSFLLIV